MHAHLGPDNVDYRQAINDLKRYLDSHRIPYQDIGVAANKILVRVKFPEYSEIIPEEVSGILVATTVSGPGRWEY